MKTVPSESATTKSNLPSPLKSPTPMEAGTLPTGVEEARTKLPVPSPSSIEIVLLQSLATARSRIPSPLKSPTATELGQSPVAGDEPGTKARLDVPPPGAGLTTVTVAVPFVAMSAAGIAAFNFEALTKVVARGLPFQ